GPRVRADRPIVERGACALVVRARPLIVEGPPDLRHRSGSAGLPERRAVGTRGDAVGIPDAVPVEDEVDEPSVVLLHPAAERQEPVDPGPRDRQLRPGPEVAPEHEGSSRVVDARDPFDAALARGDVLTGVVGVDREPERAWIVKVERPRESGEAGQHGSRLSRISRTSKSAAATTESAAP